MRDRVIVDITHKGDKPLTYESTRGALAKFLTAIDYSQVERIHVSYGNPNDPDVAVMFDLAIQKFVGLDPALMIRVQSASAEEENMVVNQPAYFHPNDAADAWYHFLIRATDEQKRHRSNGASNARSPEEIVAMTATKGKVTTPLFTQQKETFREMLSLLENHKACLFKFHELAEQLFGDSMGG